MVSVQIAGVALDAFFQTVIVLRESEGDRVLHIWIGPMEAQSIAYHLAGKVPERPWSHDLLANILATLDVKVHRVIIHDLRDDTFYASIYVQTHEGIKAIDARPSDAIALAVRTGSPIFVSGSALDAMKHSPAETDAAELERFRNLIEDVDLGEEGS